MNKTLPEEKKSKKAKWLSEEALQIPEERREAKSKGERERYTQLKQTSKNSKERQEGILQGTMHKNRGNNSKFGNIKGTFSPKLDTHTKKGRNL